MPLQKQLVRLPIIGGLDGKSAPLIAAPGSHLQLDDVRMERTGEWRRRHAWAHNALDDLAVQGGNDIIRAVELPNGGMLAFAEPSVVANTCARIYSPTSSPRWTRPPQFLPAFGGVQPPSGSGQAALSLWSRRELSYSNSPQPFVTFAQGNGLQFLAWSGAVSPTQATGMFKTIAEDKAVGTPFAFIGAPGTTAATRPRAVYFAGAPGTFALFWLEGANLWAQSWDGNGNAVLGATLVANNVAANSCLDAAIYGASATATVIYQGTNNKVNVLEVTPALVVQASGLTASSGSQCCQLLPDPDGTGTRFVASATANLQQLTLFNSSAVLITTAGIGAAAVTVTGFAGVAVNGGLGAVLVYQTNTGGIWAWKATTSVSHGVATQIIPDGTGIYIDSNGWRDIGTDAMHWIAGLHITLPGTVIVPPSDNVTGTDFQHSFYEMALEYGGVNTVANQFAEPQSRLIPMQAGPPAGCDSGGVVLAGAQVQVLRLGNGAFTLPLFRLARVDTGSSAQITNQLQYAVDRWDVTLLSASNFRGANLGQGVKTSAASYVPAGQLLQTVDGQQVVGHGASAIPYQPVLSATGGGLLTPSSTYSYLVVVEMTDEAGNVWRSTPSIPALVALNAGQNAVNVTITLSPLESPLRVRTVKLYRTQNNGSTYQLAWKQSNPVTNPIVFVDHAPDTELGTLLETALSEGEVGEQPATVTPPFSHVFLFDQRLWGIDRDFPTRVWYSKPILQGTSPEFPASFNFDVPDELGPFTGGAACDDKLVLFKSPRGLYYVPAGGPANDGSGNQYAPVRFNSEIGLVAGQPYVSTGAEVYLGAEAGIYRINGSLGVDFVGLPIDQYLGQPLVNAPDTLISATYNGPKNEIRFLGSAGQYVFDRLHGIWMRDTWPAGNNPLIMRSFGSEDVVFYAGGTMWTEGTDANVNDPASVNPNYVGRVRTVWYRPADVGGYLRLYGVILLLDDTSPTGPQQQLVVYLDNSETAVVTAVSPNPVVRGEYRARGPADRKCGSFSLQMNLAAGDVGVRLDAWTAVVGIKYGPRKLGPGQRWQ